MDYFDYNLERAGEEKGVELEVLEFTGDEVIEVDEDYSVTVDDIRRYIRTLNNEASPEADSGNIVSIWAA